MECSSEQKATVHGDKPVLEPQAVQMPPCKSLVTPVVTGTRQSRSRL